MFYHGDCRYNVNGHDNIVTKNKKSTEKIYKEITMQKVMIMFHIYIRYQELENERNPRLMWVRDIFSEQRRRLQDASDNLIIEMQLSDN